ncbi:hypothetical protein IGI04_035236 [Brassica rapa subsp. trilocularis]|uniref:Uncharacterized protein n=1 Tax=Brassica rapa subsp. trilocularis TaxID=1813537 RepID=A0ABQ7LEU2_BRACM|nr:hypothetical protein IGI04_035236 [Brassica rapa subsp. trilocularis]
MARKISKSRAAIAAAPFFKKRNLGRVGILIGYRAALINELVNFFQFVFFMCRENRHESISACPVLIDEFMNITKIIAAATRDYEVPIALLETNKIRQMSKMFIQVVLRDRVKSLTKSWEKTMDSRSLDQCLMSASNKVKVLDGDDPLTE